MAAPRGSMTTLRKLVQCPRCRFRNPATAAACLACKVALPRSSDGGARPPSSSALPRPFATAPAATMPAPAATMPAPATTAPATTAPATATPARAQGQALQETAHGSSASWPSLESHVTGRPDQPHRAASSEATTRRLTRDQAPTSFPGPQHDPQPSPPAGLSAAQVLAQLQAIARGNTAGQPPQAPAPPAGPFGGPHPATTQRFPAVDNPADTRRFEPSAPEPVRPPVSQVPRFDVDDPRIAGWLHCEPFSPVPVGLTPVLTLGRAPDSGLVLPHPGVSRTHAIVRVAGRDLVFEDRSTYGSYVNGERVLTRPLQVGDALLIGPYEIKVRSTKEVKEKVSTEAEETRPLESFRNLPSADAMSGRLEKSSLSEVLQTIEFNQKTGTLEVFTDDVSGQLVVYEGTPMFASFGDLDDDEAVFAMVGQRRGYFTFRSKIEAGERTMKITITGLLLEAGRRVDEQSASAH